jgi:hypothetical protein
VTAKAPTLREIRRWPATVEVGRAAVALGIGRSTLYEAIRCGECPVQVISVRRRHQVITASLIKLLENDGAAAGPKP